MDGSRIECTKDRLALLPPPSVYKLLKERELNRMDRLLCLLAAHRGGSSNP